MNYLKSVVKTLVKARHTSTTRFFRLTLKRFAGSQSAEKSRWRSISQISSTSFHKTTECRSYAIPGEKLSSIFSVEWFNILYPSHSGTEVVLVREGPRAGGGSSQRKKRSDYFTSPVKTMTLRDIK